MRKGNKVFGSGHNKGLESVGRQTIHYRDSPSNEALLQIVADSLQLKKSELIRECIKKSIEDIAVERGLSREDFEALKAQSQELIQTAEN